MITTVNETVTNLTEYVAAVLSENNLPFNEYIIQKIIYKIKMELGDQHLLYDKIPYYWYYHGPFSEVVKRSYRHLKVYCTHVKDDKIAIKPEHIPNYQKNKITKEFSEVEAINYTIVDKGKYIYSNLAEDIYKDYAPCKFIYHYKYKVFNLTDKEHFESDGNEFLKLLKHCESQLQHKDFELNYSIIFTKLVMAIDFLNDEQLIADYWTGIKQHLRELWFSYAKGLRIKNHEDYYDNKNQLWGQIYKKSLDDCNYKVDLILDKSLNVVDSSNYGLYNSNQKKLSNAIAEAI